MIQWNLGKLPPTVGRLKEYFDKRGCLLDCRGPLVISKDSYWGFAVKVITQSHDTRAWPAMSKATPYGVVVEDGAWIGSFSILAGCVIGHHSIVAAGTVVRGQEVAPNIMVAGNPARVIARWDGKQWVYLPDEETGYKRVLK